MRVIIQMTSKEFDSIMTDNKFTSRKDFAKYVSNTYNGGEDIDIIEVVDEKTGDKYWVYSNTGFFINRV